MNKKRRKQTKKQPYKKKKAYYKSDKFFVVLIIFLILLMVNIIYLLNYNLKTKQVKEELNNKIKIKEEKLNNYMNTKKGDIIFLGDSITDFYDLDKYYDVPIVNSGVAGWTTDDILNNLDEKVFEYNPKKLILLIGTNDLRDEKSPEYVFENIKKIIKKITKERPKCKIYIESIYPINNTDDEKINHDMVGVRTNENINKINEKLKKYCNENKLIYINMHDILLDENKNLNLKYTKEGLHMSDEGYEVITKELLKYLKS